MHLQAYILESYWKFSWAHSVHIYNKTPSQHHDWWIPYEKLNKQSPDIRHLCIFGCEAYIYLPTDVYTNKMAPKLELMVYLGIAPNNDKNFLFIYCPNNVKFISWQALLISSYVHFVINLHEYVPKSQLLRMIRLILIFLHLMAMIMTYHPLLHHLFVHLNHLVHTCLNAVQLLSPPRRPCKAAPKCNLPVGISAVPPAPIWHPRHEHYILYWPDNVYCDHHHLVNQLKDIKRDKASASSESRIPGSFPDAVPPNISVSDMTATNLSKDEIECITREGGDALNTYLLSKVIWLDSITIDPSKS